MADAKVAVEPQVDPAVVDTRALTAPLRSLSHATTTRLPLAATQARPVLPPAPELSAVEPRLLVDHVLPWSCETSSLTPPELAFVYAM